MVTGLLDTAILVDVLRGHQPAVRWLGVQGQLAVTPISWLELLQGATDKRAQQSALKLLQVFIQVDLTSDDIQWAINQTMMYSLSHNVSAFDCLVAAPASRLQLPLYTTNLKHLSPLLGELAQRPY